MIWDKISLLRGLFPSRQVAGEVSVRWWRARNREPELAADLIRLGGLLTTQPMQDGELVDRSAYALAYEAGRADLARQLLAMMNLNHTELNTMMETNDAQ